MTEDCARDDGRARASVFAIKTADGATMTVVCCTMSWLRATVLMAIAASGSCSVRVGSAAETTAATGRRFGGGGGGSSDARLWSSADWYRATVDGCGTVGWLRCVARKVSRTIRPLEDADHLQIADGVRLVKTARTTTTDHSARNNSSNVIDRMISFVDSHSLQIDLWIPDNNATVEGRRRHAYRKVFPIIVGTYMIMSAVLIPMGFMFMSTLGGKALLVSKMALMVSLMSNIKKIFSYEYYVPPAPPPASHHQWKRTLLAHRTTAGPLYSSYTTY